VPILLANILTVLAYLAAIVFCGWQAYQTNHSWLEATFVAGEVLCLFIIILLVLDAVMFHLHAPDGLRQKWRQRQ
jgi:hypothetical protein